MTEQSKPPYQGRHAGPIKIKDPDAPAYTPRHAKPRPPGPHQPRLVIPKVGSQQWRRTMSTLSAAFLFAGVLLAAGFLINILR